ncbi:MAG TPA: heme-binding domain-containing protein [Acidobacteriaceae bacterium]|nr:heme-binding domain-containing protein [Acidobacteriaceae bacterium]
MKRLPLLLLSAAALLAGSLLLAQVHPFGDPLSAIPASAPQTEQIPPEVRVIISEKCADCHSSPAHLPLYGHLAPASWLIERDVVRARAAMDLSRWRAWSPEEQETLRSKVAQAAKTRSMPPPQYLAMHWNARLTQGDIQILTRWAAAHPAPVAVPQTGVPGNPQRGRLVFEKRCTGCHALDRDREGPHLAGVYGRPSGTAHGFDYSDALRQAHLVWSDASLDRWLTDPDAFLPGNNMEFHVANPQERADLIRFLRDQASR